VNQERIKSILRKILNREDTDSEILNREVLQRPDEIEVLLEHVVLLVADLRFDALASRKEMFEARKLLER
jgi:hypothetical protein